MKISSIVPIIRNNVILACKIHLEHDDLQYSELSFFNWSKFRILCFCHRTSKCSFLMNFKFILRWAKIPKWLHIWEFKSTVFSLTVKLCDDPKLPKNVKKYFWNIQNILTDYRWCDVRLLNFLLYVALYIIYNLCTFMLFCMSFSVLANTHTINFHL